MSDIEQDTSSQIERYLEFKLGHENYAVQLLKIKEVIPHPETTPLPNGPSHFLGVMNLRGQIISVVDLRKKLKIAIKDEDQENAVIIMNFDGICIGLVVDSIDKVLNVSMSDVSEIPEVESAVNGKYIQGIYKHEESLVVLLNLEKVLDIDQIRKLQEKAA
jgi:purine-binding chemotaxis protein CheW